MARARGGSMTVQQIHEHIWSHVMQEMTIPSEDFSIKRAKVEAVTDLYLEKRISYEAKELLHNHLYCVLCVLYKCNRCPLKRCDSDDLYGQAVRGDVEAARVISHVNVVNMWHNQKNRRILEKGGVNE